MPRLRKLRRKQKYQYNVNRRRLNTKLKKLPRIDCEAVRNVWNNKKSLNDNLTSMGLLADTSKDKNFRIPSGRQQMKKMMTMGKGLLNEAETFEELEEVPVAENASVVVQLAEEAKAGYEAKKAVAHPLPPEMLKKLTKLIDKHGEDFEAMARDHTNFYQETPAQFRAQVNRLKKIPQQWIPYLKSRDLLK